MESLKVVARVRPFNERERKMNAECIIKMENNQTSILNFPYKSSTTGKKTTTEFDWHDFQFDASYWSFDQNDQHYKGQQDIFSSIGEQIVNKALERYNTSICAYGQTGSGKSYSMMGETLSEIHKGIIPRLCNQLIEKIKDDSYIEISYIEIYRENIADLLCNDIKTKLKVRDIPKIGVHIENLTKHRVSDFTEIASLLNKGNMNRKTSNTNMNDASSRSHAIFSLKIISEQKYGQEIKTELISKIDLVDLAGSERSETSGTNGLHLKEGISINKSLSAFINVLISLSNLDGKNGNLNHHIPYRDSTLTWLLKDSIGGNSMTVFLATISPAHINYNQTLSTLRYASSAKRIKNKVTIYTILLDYYDII